MKDEQEKWIDAILNSTQGSRRAQPSADLFAKIEQQLPIQQARIISIGQRRIAIVAAVLLLLANIFVLQQYTGSVNSEATIANTSEMADKLISDYNIYQ